MERHSTSGKQSFKEWKDGNGYCANEEALADWYRPSRGTKRYRRSQNSSTESESNDDEWHSPTLKKGSFIHSDSNFDVTCEAVVISKDASMKTAFRPWRPWINRKRSLTTGKYIQHCHVEEERGPRQLTVLVPGARLPKRESKHFSSKIP